MLQKTSIPALSLLLTLATACGNDDVVAPAPAPNGEVLWLDGQWVDTEQTLAFAAASVELWFDGDGEGLSVGVWTVGVQDDSWTRRLDGSNVTHAARPSRTGDELVSFSGSIEWLAPLVFNDQDDRVPARANDVVVVLRDETGQQVQAFIDGPFNVGAL